MDSYECENLNFRSTAGDVLRSVPFCIPSPILRYQNLATTKWSGKAEISEPSLQSIVLWPLKNESVYRAEKMWSGPEPEACGMTAHINGKHIGRSLLSDGPVVEVVDEANYLGCYRKVENTALVPVLEEVAMKNEVGIDMYGC